MTPTIPSEIDPLSVSRTPVNRGQHARSERGDDDHAVSWAAIFAGAAAASALSLILLVLGTGLGLSSVSPWSSQGLSATTVGVGTIAWLLFMALAASGTGGYLAGRLRTRWLEAHADEVYFRDTAHGFLAWAIATLITAGMLTSTIGSIVSGSAQAGGAAVGAVGSSATALAAGAGGAAMNSDSTSMGYLTDSLFRPVAPAAGASAPATMSGDSSNATRSTAEIGRIVARSITNGALAPEDVKYAGQVVAQRTGMSQSDAEKRVSDTFAKAQKSIEDVQAKAKDAVDKARKTAAYAALWLFVSLLFGAFISSLMATFGGRQRDL